VIEESQSRSLVGSLTNLYWRPSYYFEMKASRWLSPFTEPVYWARLLSPLTWARWLLSVTSERQLHANISVLDARPSWRFPRRRQVQPSEPSAVGLFHDYFRAHVADFFLLVALPLAGAQPRFTKRDPNRSAVTWSSNWHSRVKGHRRWEFRQNIFRRLQFAKATTATVALQVLM